MLWVERKGKEGEYNLLNMGCVPITPISVSDTLHTSMILFPTPTHQRWDPSGSYLCMHVYAKSLQSCSTVYEPMVCPWNSPGKTLEWVAMPSSRGSSWLRSWTHITFPVLVGRFFFFFFKTTSSTWEALWSLLLTDKQIETRGEKPHPWQRVCLGSAANRLCDLFPLAGYLWFISSVVQWMSWTRILVNSGRKVLDSNIPSIFCRFCGLLPEEQVRWLSEFHSACQPIW